jgi:hypothetical protein
MIYKIKSLEKLDISRKIWYNKIISFFNKMHYAKEEEPMAKKYYHRIDAYPQNKRNRLMNLSASIFCISILVQPIASGIGIVNMFYNVKNLEPPVIIADEITIEDFDVNTYTTKYEYVVYENEELPDDVVIASPVISSDGPGEVYYYNLSEEDKLYIAKTVYREARGESFEGQVAVAAVVLNRYVSDMSFFKNDTIYDVVTQENQFADITGVTEDNLEEYPDCMKAVEAACKGWDPTRDTFPETGALYFYDPNGAISDYQRNLREGVTKKVIGSHYFHVEFNTEAINN